MKRRNKAFTLVEIMIVILIMGILLAMALPQMVTARANSQKRACQNNQRMYDAAKTQWAMDNNIPAGTPVAFGDIGPYIRRIAACPSGGVYDLTTTSTPTTCSLPQHPNG
jgi:prepilin-type N-terminal cleavage/methylation domain-containing protein